MPSLISPIIVIGSRMHFIPFSGWDLSAANSREGGEKRHKDANSGGNNSSNSGSVGGNSTGNIKGCGTAKGDATWAGAQETHRWAWRLSLRGAPGRHDMKLYTGSPPYTQRYIPLSFSPDRFSLAYAAYIPVAVAAGQPAGRPAGGAWRGGTNK